MCINNNKSSRLPEQTSLCQTKNSSCRHVQVNTGIGKWEKQLAVLVEDEEQRTILYLYKAPLIGKKFELPCKKLSFELVEKEYVVKLKNEKETLNIKVCGKDATQFIAALISLKLDGLNHDTHKVDAVSQTNSGSSYERTARTKSVVEQEKENSCKVVATALRVVPSYALKKANDDDKSPDKSMSNERKSKSDSMSKRIRKFGIPNEKHSGSLRDKEKHNDNPAAPDFEPTEKIRTRKTVEVGAVPDEKTAVEQKLSTSD